MAVANYHDANGCFPPAYIAGPDGRPWHSWRILILPYIEHQGLYNEYNFDEPWDGPNNRKLVGRMPQTFAFHGSDRRGNTLTNYLAVVGDETGWPDTKSVTYADVTDGSGTTIMVVENRGADVHWLEPRDLSLAEMDLRLNNPVGISSPYVDPAVAMFDGSIRRLKANLQPATLRALLTIRGGEELQDDGQHGWELLPDGRLRARK